MQEQLTACLVNDIGVCVQYSSMISGSLEHEWCGTVVERGSWHVLSLRGAPYSRLVQPQHKKRLFKWLPYDMYCMSATDSEKPKQLEFWGKICCRQAYIYFFSQFLQCPNLYWIGFLQYRLFISILIVLIFLLSQCKMLVNLQFEYLFWCQSKHQFGRLTEHFWCSLHLM